MAETPTPRVTYDFVTRAIARTLATRARYYALLTLAVALLSVGIVCLCSCCATGWGSRAIHIRCTGRFTSPASCSGGHCPLGTLISAILFAVPLGLADPCYRTAEAMTVFA